MLISLAECHTVVVIRNGEIHCSQLMPKILRSLTKVLGLCRKETLGVFAHINLKNYNEMFKAVRPAHLTEFRYVTQYAVYRPSIRVLKRGNGVLHAFSGHSVFMNE